MVVSTDAWTRAQQLAREAEDKAKALAEAEAAEEEMAKRASSARTQEAEAREVATRKKDEAKEDLDVAQQAERQAVTAVQEAEKLLRAAKEKSAVSSLAHQKVSGGQDFVMSSGFRAVTTLSPPLAKDAPPMSNSETMLKDTFTAAAPQPAAPQQQIAFQTVEPQPVDVQPLAAPTIGTQPPPSMAGQGLTPAQARKFSAQVEAAAAKADLAKAFHTSKEAHRSEATALAHASAPGLDAAAKQAATAELAMARSKHAEAASVVQAAKARAAKAYEEVILSEETEGAASAPVSAAMPAIPSREVEVASAADATKTRAATVYEDALARVAQVAHSDKMGMNNLHTALKREDVVADTALKRELTAGGREQIASIMPTMSSGQFETRHTKLARERVDKALAAATNKEEEVKRVEAWSAALIDAAKQKADQAMRLAKADVMKADDEAATKLVSFVKAKEREAAKVAEEALAKQAEAAKIAQEAANARDEANNAARKAAQWKADAVKAIKSTQDAIKGGGPIKATALATMQGRPESAPLVQKTRRKQKGAAITAATMATATLQTRAEKSDAAAKPIRAVDAQPRSNRAAGATLRQKKAALAVAEPKAAKTVASKEAVRTPTASPKSLHRSKAADGRAAAVRPASKAALRKAETWARVSARKAASLSATRQESISATAITTQPLSSGHGWAIPSAEHGASQEGGGVAEKDTPPPGIPLGVAENNLQVGPAGHRIRLAWRAMRDTVMALEDARGVGQPGLQDAFTKQSAALGVLTKMFPRMDDLPTVRSPDLHTLFSQSKELGGLILVEEAKTLCAAALKELREQKAATKDGEMTSVERMQKAVYDSLVTAESSARQRVEGAARKIAAEKNAKKAASEAEARKRALVAEEKDKAVLGQLRAESRKKASNAVALKVKAMQAEKVAKAHEQEMEATVEAARLAEEEAQMESAKALLDEAAAAGSRRREELRKERRNRHEEDNLEKLSARMSKDAAAADIGKAATAKDAPVTAEVASRPATTATRKGGVGEKRVQRPASDQGDEYSFTAPRAGEKKAAPANRPIVKASALAKKGLHGKTEDVAAQQEAVATGQLIGKQNRKSRRAQQLIALEAHAERPATAPAAAAAAARRDAKRERKLAGESMRPQKANTARE
jgi:hypothetical protein